MHRHLTWLSLLATSWLLSVAPVRAADPGYYVATPYDNAGLRMVDLRYGSVKRRDRPEVIWPEIGFSYGVNSRWTTVPLRSTIGPSNWDIVPSALIWQNDVMLTQGEWPFDIALHTKLIREAGHDGRVWAIEYGPVLQTDLGRTQLNASIFFERGFEPEEGRPIQMKYQWQVRHRWHPLMNFGLQGFGELDSWGHWRDNGRQSHRAGPAFFGRVDLGQGTGDKRALLYQAAYLLGTVYSQRAAMFTVRLQYQF